jgi:hypothetical protein
MIGVARTKQSKISNSPSNNSIEVYFCSNIKSNNFKCYSVNRPIN